jgi:U3 small nucleolar RNA-associated protein 22
MVALVLAKFKFEKEAVFVKSASGPQVCVLFSVLCDGLTFWWQFPPEEYDVQQQPVFVDSTSLVNLLSGVPRGALELVGPHACFTPVPR